MNRIQLKYLLILMYVFLTSDLMRSFKDSKWETYNESYRWLKHIIWSSRAFPHMGSKLSEIKSPLYVDPSTKTLQNSVRHSSFKPYTYACIIKGWVHCLTVKCSHWTMHAIEWVCVSGQYRLRCISAGRIWKFQKAKNQHWMCFNMSARNLAVLHFWIWKHHLMAAHAHIV